MAERPQALALAAGLLTVALWGSAFVGIRSAGTAFSPGALALGRLLVSCVALGMLAFVRREPPPNRGDLVSIAIYGVLWLGIYSVTLNAAEHRVDAGIAAMLVNTGPIILAILAGIFLGEGFPSHTALRMRVRRSSAGSCTWESVPPRSVSSRGASLSGGRAPESSGR